MTTLKTVDIVAAVIEAVDVRFIVVSAVAEVVVTVIEDADADVVAVTEVQPMTMKANITRSTSTNIAAMKIVSSFL